MTTFKAGRFSIRIERAHGPGHRQRMALPHTPAVRLTRHGATGPGRRPDLPSQLQRAPDPAERPGGEAVPQRVLRDLVSQLRSIESIEADFAAIDLVEPETTLGLDWSL